MAAISSLSCFAFKAAAPPITAAGPAYRHLSSLLRTNSATSFHKIPTLRSVGRQPAAEAAPFWPRPAAEYVAAKVGGSQEPEKSPVVAVAETPPAAEEVTPAPATEAVETEEVTQAAAEEAPATEAAAAVKEEESTEARELTKKLVELLEGTDRGLKASSETTAEILEVISQLEAINPTPAPTEALALLDGKWILAYTSYSQLVPLLRSVRLPELVKVVEISQTFDAENFTVQNAVKISGLLVTTSVTTTAKFEVQSPKRVQIKFEEGSISTPQLTDAIVVPEGADLLGQHIDFSPLKNAMSSVQDAAARVAKSLSSTFPGAAASVDPLALGSLALKFPIAGNLDPNPWLLTTYLDESMRISRGGDSSVYVLFKDASA